MKFKDIKAGDVLFVRKHRTTSWVEASDGEYLKASVISATFSDRNVFWEHHDTDVDWGETGYQCGTKKETDMYILLENPFHNRRVYGYDATPPDYFVINVVLFHDIAYWLENTMVYAPDGEKYDVSTNEDKFKEDMAEFCRDLRLKSEKLSKEREEIMKRYGIESDKAKWEK